LASEFSGGFRDPIIDRNPLQDGEEASRRAEVEAGGEHRRLGVEALAGEADLPVEAYPDIRFGVGKEIKAPQAFFTFGLANDQLGYLIAPASEYPWITYSNPGNDNGLFNVSVQYGDHLYCTEAAEAHALGFTATNDPAPYGPNATAPNCAASGVTDQVPMGPAPQQPWVLGDGTTPPFGT
jgi:hypothetical protein